MQPSGQKLPVLGERHLEFRCNGCGACCRQLRVSITHHDLWRLLEATRSDDKQERARAVPDITPLELVDWLAPDAVDMTDEPGSFVELSEGRRLMVLAQRQGACIFLDPAQRCGAYASRPHDCRLFPFNLARDAAGTVIEVSLLELEGCGDERGPRAALLDVAELDRRRWRELGEYQALVARWNRLVSHRRRFRRRAGDRAAFLAWLAEQGARSPAPVVRRGPSDPVR